MPEPDILVRSSFEPALFWMISVSVAAHALAILLVLVVPEEFLRRSPRLVSYTVDLTPASEIGGTNIGGSGGVGKRAPAPARIASNPPPAPALKKEAEKAAQPPEAVKPPAPVVPDKPAPVQKVVPVEKPKEPPKAEKPPEAAKAVEPPPKAAAPVPVEKPKPAVADRKAEPKPAPPPAQQAKAVAAKPEAEKAKPPAPVAAAAPTPADKKAGAGDDTGQRDRMIAAAVQRRAEALKQDGGRGAPGIGGGAGSGPASIGSGEGSGGITKGLEWVMYVRQLEAKIKGNWVWTVKDGARVVEVWFQILPTGEVVNAKITKSSGDASFDVSAQRAVSGASPLAPPPERYRNEFGSDGVLFTFNESESRF